MQTGKNHKIDLTDNSPPSSAGSSHKKHFIVRLKIFCLIAVCFVLAILVFRYNSIPPVQAIFEYEDTTEPAMVTEKMDPWYMGNVSFDLPQSLAVAEMKIRLFYETEGATETIFVSEHLSRPAESPDDLFFNPRYYSKSLNFFASKDGNNAFFELSSGYDRYYHYYYVLRGDFLSGMSVHYTNRPVPNSTETQVQFHALGHTSDDGRLYFNYSTTVEFGPDGKPAIDSVKKKEAFFLSRIRNFAKAYTWTGQNECSESGQLSTMYGSINSDQNVLWKEIRLKSIIGSNVRPKFWRKKIYFDFVEYFNVNWAMNINYGPVQIAAKSPQDVEKKTFFSIVQGNSRDIFKSRRISFAEHEPGEIGVAMLAHMDGLEAAKYVLGLFGAVCNSIKPVEEAACSTQGYTKEEMDKLTKIDCPK